MAENSVWKAKWGRAADLALPFPSRRPGRFNRRREKTKIEALDVRDAQRAAKSNGRLPCRGSTLKSRSWTGVSHREALLDPNGPGFAPGEAANGMDNTSNTVLTYQRWNIEPDKHEDSKCTGSPHLQLAKHRIFIKHTLQCQQTWYERNEARSGKPTLLLKERHFKPRADILGTVWEDFDILRMPHTISEAVSRWLADLGKMREQPWPATRACPRARVRKGRKWSISRRKL